MDEEQVRALVRQAIIRHMSPGAAAAPVAASGAQSLPVAIDGGGATGIAHARFALVRPAGEVECLIEPAVICNHCGYCQCYGH